MTIVQAAAAAQPRAAGTATPWLLLGITVLLLAIAAVLFVVLRKRVKKVEDDAPADPAREPLLVPSTPRRSFAAGLAALRSYVPGRDGRYAVPWVAVMGTGGSGASTVADSVGLPRPFQARVEDEGRDPVRWSFFDQGVLLDLPGAWTRRRAGATPDTTAWRGFLRLLRWNRPGRPLDALVLTLAADDLAGPDAPGKQALLERAELVRERLTEAQERLGVRFPVHVLVTRCDRIPGFAATWRELPEAARDEVFGWSSPYPVGASFSPAWVDEAYDTVGAELYETQVELLAGASSAQADGLFRFPAELRRTLPSLRRFLGEVFRESSYHESFFFRGIYFTGDPEAPGSFATDLAPAASAAPSADPLAAEPAYADEYGERDEDAADAPGARPVTPIFLRQLFSERIFAEAGLARPTGRGSWLDGGRWARAAQAAAAVILLLGMPTLFFAGRRLDRTGDRVQTALETSRVVLAQLEAESQPDASSRTAGHPNVVMVVEQMGALPVDRLWSLFIPASWPGDTREQLREAQVASFRDAVYPAMHHRLAVRADALTAPLPGAGPWHPSAATPALLATYLRELGLLSRNVNRYNDLATQGRGTPEDLEELTSYLYRIPPSAPTEARRNGFAWAVRHATAQKFSGNRTNDAVQRARDLTGSVYLRLGATLDELEGGTFTTPAAADAAVDPFTGAGGQGGTTGAANGWASRAPAAPARSGGYSFAVQDDGADADAWPEGAAAASPPSAAPFPAARLSGYFAGADSVWLVAGPPDDLPPGVEAALAALEESAVLDADLFRREFPQQFAEERSTRLGGMDPAGLGQPGTAAQSARSMVALRDALSRLQAQPFASGGVPVELRAMLAPGAPVAWDTTALAAALARYDAYTAFVNAPGVSALPSRSRNLVQTLARAQLEAGMTLDVARGARSGGTGAALLAGGGERQLRARVAGLQPAAPQLARILAAYRAEGLAPSYDDLATVLATDGQAVLSAAEQLLEDRGLYLPRDGGFGWWNGETPVSFAAFGVSDADGLSAWLADQRAAVQQIYTLYAEPVLALLDASPMADFASAPTLDAAPALESAERWAAIGRQLAAYDAKKPGSLGSLESLITGAMGTMAPGDCAPASSRGGGGSDWFAARRERLRSGVWTRCRQLSSQAVAAGYGRLADAFQSDLAGRFPFADADVGDEADPAAVAAFFRLYAASGAVRRSVASGTDGVGGPGSAAASFLARMDAAAAFLTPLLGADTAGGPSYLARPEFRAARERESGADQVAEWGLRVGGASLAQRDSASASLLWSPGAPVWMTFRWADGSLVRPTAAGLPHGARVSGPALTFGFGGSWALLRLLRTRATAGPAHTLGFAATTAAVPSAVPHATPGNGVPGPVQLFVRLRLYDPTGGRERVLPPFPTDAPALGGGFQ